MKFALVNGEKIEAIKGVKGKCPACGSEMIPKICKNKVDHWAHKSKQDCDLWWENETEWHREWKNYFNVEWQEYVHKDKNTGEIHIADVTTPHGWTIEFQHSPIDYKEREARNTFYKKIAWVVDGTQRKTDIEQLNHLLSSGVRINAANLTFAINPDYKNRLLDEWYNNESLVFFDFKQVDTNGQRIIWFVLPKYKPKDSSFPDFLNYLFIQAFPIKLFVDTHKNGVFDQFFKREIYEHVLDYCKEFFNKRRLIKIKGIPDPKYSWVIADSKR